MVRPTLVDNVTLSLRHRLTQGHKKLTWNPSPLQPTPRITLSVRICICYCHQDLRWGPLHVRSPETLPRGTATPPYTPTSTLGLPEVSNGRGNSLGSRLRAPSIFRAKGLDKCAVTRSLKDASFHGHLLIVIDPPHRSMVSEDMHDS